MKPFNPCRPVLPALLLIAAMCLIPHDDSEAQPAGYNYDEANVPSYTLPDPLLGQDGRMVSSAEDWSQWRRTEVLELFQTHMYGKSPNPPPTLTFKVLESDPMALGGLATRKQVAVHLTGKPDGPGFTLLIYIPNRAAKPAPAFVGLNFKGNHSIHADPGILIVDQGSWDRDSGKVVVTTPDPGSRGASSSRWAVERILQRGYALLTAHYGDIEPDVANGWRAGIRKTFRPTHATGTRSREGHPDGAAVDDWSAIGAWAWGLSRILDYCEQDDTIDARHVAVLGHSRLGKTSLWAGAQDERFALVISNDSGCGGAALNRRRFGETVKRINDSFPHWFCLNFRQYNEREDTLPMDQHMLIALMAPRPVYIASAQEDLWADPRGEFLSGWNADPVYALFGKKGLGQPEPPDIDHPIGDTIGYHNRTGKHDVTDYDWTQYMNFADRHFGRSANR